MLGPMATLTVREPGRVAVRVPLGEGLVLGRDEGCDLVLADPKASRRHVEIAPLPGGGWRATDLGSRNRLLVNGEPAAAHDLRHGDAIQIGATLVLFSTEDDLQTESPLPPPAAPPRGGDAAARRLRVLYDIARAVEALDDPDELVGRLLEAALDVLDAERGVVGLSDGRSAGGRRIARGAADDLAVSRSVLRALVERRERVLIAGRDHDAEPTLVRQGVRSAMAVPLIASSGLLGYLYVDDRARADRFSASEMDFLSALGQLLSSALERARQHRKVADLAEAVSEGPAAELWGASPPMKQLRVALRKFAAADATILLRGESGTGKELAARALHALSPRAGGPFVAVNCAAIPDNLIESELFGHEKGAFTGAIRARRGKLAQAHQGTLFLDEIGELGAAAQAKLLRVLEDGQVHPVGADEPIQVSVRVVAATNRRLEEDIDAGRFREDLYFRLSVGEIHLPPLRARGDDVVLLAELFLRDAARRVGKTLSGFTDEALEVLRGRDWPGNVRQLRNAVERAAIVADGPLIVVDDLPALPPDAGDPGGAETWAALLRERAQLEAAERRILAAVLERNGGVVSRAARELGLPRSTFVSRLEALGLAG
jgi:Nif-specific regulatory protein